MASEMRAADAVEILRLFRENGIEVYVDGGWGVDALLGEQTRPHSDLDIAFPHEHVAMVRVLLEARGFRDVSRDDTRDCNFVLGNADGRQVDIHTYAWNANGENIFGVEYLPEHFTGKGSINGYAVSCVGAEWSVRFHTGYPLDADDYHDVKRLCERFQIELPPEYFPFEATSTVETTCREPAPPVAASN